MSTTCCDLDGELRPNRKLARAEQKYVVCRDHMDLIGTLVAMRGEDANTCPGGWTDRKPPMAEQSVVMFLRSIAEMLEDDRYQWAEGTLTGIQETVEKNGRVSERQRVAVSNIRIAGEKEKDY